MGQFFFVALASQEFGQRVFGNFVPIVGVGAEPGHGLVGSPFFVQ